jgi:hypothetical protein
MPGRKMGLIWALLTIAASIPLQDEQVLHLFVALLGVAVGVYIGGEMGARESPHFWLVTSSGLGFLVLGLFGIWESPGFLVAAWGLHAMWDVFHRHEHPPEPAPEGGVATAAGDTYDTGSGRDGGLAPWYPSACLTYDIVVAAYLLVWWQFLS